MEKEENNKGITGKEDNSETEESNLYESLPEIEKESWIEFHKQAYEDDIKHAEKDLMEFPRWSIISAYYAMHDITKLYLGEIHNVKIVSENVHSKTLKALNEFIQDKKEKERVIGLLKKGEISFFNVLRLEEKTLPLMLRKGKTERGKTQYYSKDFSDISSQRSIYFFDKIVKPYIEIMKGMLLPVENPEDDENVA